MPELSSHAQRKHRSNIPSLVAAFAASLTTGGTTYAFGLYGAVLKRDLRLSASQLDTISTAFFFAGLLSWIPGLCADRFGARFSIALGGCTGATSLLSYWVVARQFVVLPRPMLVPTLSILGISIFLSCALVTGSVFKIIVSSCGPGTKGSAVGVAKGYVGLGSGAYAVLFESIRGPTESPLDFLPMAAFFFIVCATIPALVLLPSRQQVMDDVMLDDATPRHFRVLFVSLGIMATLVVGSSLMELFDSSPNHSHAPQHRHLFSAFLLVSAWLGPIAGLLYLPTRHHETRNSVTATGENEERITEDELDAHEPQSGLDPMSQGSERGDISLHKIPAQKTDGDEEASDIDGEEEGVRLLGVDDENGSAPTMTAETDEEENLNLLQMLQTPSALLMLWTTTILVGAGTVETNNMGDMVGALGFPEAVTPASLALFSVAQAAGRVATGAISESALNWNTRRFCIDNGVPRPFFLLAASCVGVLAHFTLGMATHEFFFVIGAALSGAAFGMVWPLMVLIVGEVFGTANAGANYMFFDGFTSAAGTLLLTKLLAQEVYEAHIDPHADDTNTCVGTGCFQLTHMIVAFLSLTCVGTSAAMLYTSRHVYNKSSLHHRD